MAFVVEDGTGEDPLANSYASVAEFKVYWDDRGFNYTIYSPDAALERALVKATDFIERKYRRSFVGCRLLSDQPLSWPRAYAWLYGAPLEGVPVLVKQATFEYAKIELTTPGGLAPNPAGYDATGQLVNATVKKVGPIEIHQKYEAGSGAAFRSYPYADGLLSELVTGAGGVVRN